MVYSTRISSRRAESQSMQKTDNSSSKILKTDSCDVDAIDATRAY